MLLATSRQPGGAVAGRIGQPVRVVTPPPSRATAEALYIGNPFAENNLCIAHLDQLTCVEDLQSRLRAVE